jgi:hypothetical protein
MTAPRTRIARRTIAANAPPNETSIETLKSASRNPSRGLGPGLDGEYSSTAIKQREDPAQEQAPSTSLEPTSSDVISYAREADMEGYRLSDLPLPPEDRQTTLRV